MYKNRSRGFTLIELLVVIAIIGILSAVVLASLNTARSKGNDAAIKSNLDTIRTQSGIYYDTNTGYSTGATTVVGSTSGTNALCTAAYTDLFNDTNVTNAIAAAVTAAGGSANVYCAMDSQTTPTKTTQWAVYAKMTAVANTWWCVDSTGQSKQVNAASVTLGAGITCP